MPRPRPPYLHLYRTRHGKLIWYVRLPGCKRVRIRAEYGTPEFAEAYQCALEGESIPKARKATTGSLAWLWDRYRDSGAWLADLSAATRKQRENIMSHVLETAGGEPYGAVTKAHVLAGRERRSNTPSQARNFLDAMRGLFRWAVAAGHLTDDPTEGADNPKRKKSEGFKAWNMAEVRQYEERWPAGTRQRVWLHVLLYVGSRRGDAVTHGKQHVRNNTLTFITEKGRDRERIEVSRRIEPELAATLARGPCGDLAFICGERGTPLTKESFGNDFKVACVAAGILDKSAHGLRKLSATIWAERGATEMELMAMFGWLTPAMAALYTRAARRKLLSLNAQDRLPRTVNEHPMCSPDNEVGTPAVITK